jgi:tryptophanase
MPDIRFFGKETFPLEMHKVRVVQKLTLLPVEQRQKAIEEAGNNTFLLKNKDVFLDMLTDSGVNAMSDRQTAAMMTADDAYAGSATFERLGRKLTEIFGTKYFLPCHQGRAAEHLIAKALVKSGDVVPTNYHFTTTKAHIGLQGGSVTEIHYAEALDPSGDNPFKGNVSPELFEEQIKQYGADKIPFLRMEAGTNLIGGQPFSIANLRANKRICEKHGIPLVLDASLLADNLYFVKTREDEFKNASVPAVAREFADNSDLIYFSARKLGHARGGGICTNNKDMYMKIRELVPVYEGFLTYGGMSVREMEAIAVGLDETMDMDMISQGPMFIAHMVKELLKRGIPVVTPAGGLGCHLNASEFCGHVPQAQYTAGALAAAVYIAGGIRGMERGTLSEERNPDGSENYSNMELLRLAMPRRVFTLSQVMYAVDRIEWLYANRKLIGGLIFSEEPKLLRFFLGKLVPAGDWQKKLVAQFKKDFGDSL